MNILTFDIEDWFHILDNKRTESVTSWRSYESRIAIGMNHIFEILDKRDLSATFFVVGWIAEMYPEIIKQISDMGYEIASHTHYHQLAYLQNPKSFKADVEKSIKTLEDCTGKKVKSFRAPGFSITKNNLWAFEVLYELGIEIDSSIFPASRAHGGLPTYSASSPAIIEFNGVHIKEFPINTFNFYGTQIIFSGGGYFRVLPYNVIRSLTKRSDYVMSYFHPRDFDYNQPFVPGLSPLRIFKSYVGLKRCKNKLKKWTNDFNFIDLEKADRSINWEKKDKFFL